MAPGDRLSRLSRLAALAATLLVAAGCGGDGSGPARSRHTVVVALDFTPNAVHAPIYAAVRTGQDRANGIRLRIRPPGEGPDSL
ncbi:MAG TPA: hypothetical protein VGJ70_13995, partial [Solirubrobacteraceae bacterium]